ncbi:MAG TPA: altronate dehydratase family protein [Rhodothermales bacterium]|nr:altronate dehydratase family protein [Rhodothermales bacterium]
MEAKQVDLAPPVLLIHPADTVAVALRPLAAGAEVEVAGKAVVLRDDVPAGHKLARRSVAEGEQVFKYGHVIGHATRPIPEGAWVHTHNLRTDLEGARAYRYEPVRTAPQQSGGEAPVFMGYRRVSGRVGTRNEIWVLNTVGCVNTAAEMIARMAREELADAGVDGVYAFSHPYGCSQLGDDLVNTRRVLAGLMRHPNAGGILVIGLGCENNQMADLLAEAGDVDESRVRFFNAQDVADEIETGLDLCRELAGIMASDRRQACSVSDLVLGVKCGGSDGYSGVTANPLVGRATDRLTAYGGTALMTEVPEMFGAEQQLMNRAQDEQVFERVVGMINRFKEYFIAHGQPVYENPSPGNKDGGLTTLEEKSLGATQKGGRAIVTQVLEYGEQARRGGLALVNAPGNDAVSSTALTVSGATVILFTTGRGTPLGFPAPTVKISTNTPIYEKKTHWIDFNAGALIDGTASMDELENALLRFILDVASGRVQARNEVNGVREIAIWKQGVTV